MLTTTTIAYKTIGGGRYLAMITGDKITHVPDGDWSRAFTSDRIDYVTSSGRRYIAKFENDQFLHAPDGDFNRAHRSKHLDYQNWEGQSYFATLDRDTFTFGQSAPENIPTTKTIAYKTIWGGNYLAMISGDQVTHVPDGDWSRAFTSDRIDYVTSSGKRYVAKLVDGQFLHAPDGDFSRAHQSKHLDFQSWGGKGHFVTLDQDIFSFGSSATESGNPTVIKGRWEIKETPKDNKSNILTYKPFIIGPTNWEQKRPTYYLDRNGKLTLEPPNEGDIIIHGYKEVIRASDNIGDKTEPRTPSGGSNARRDVESSSMSNVFTTTRENSPEHKPGSEPYKQGQLLSPSDEKKDVSHAIYGSEGSDIIIGSSVHDHIEGGGGDDIIFGGGGDAILGGAGNDTINVRGGKNNLTGGIGADIFRLRNVSLFDTTTITDFRYEDEIQLFNSDFNPSNKNIADLQNGPTFAVNEVVNLGSSSGLRYLQSKGQLFYDADGGDFSSGGQLITTLTNKPTIESLHSRISIM